MSAKRTPPSATLKAKEAPPKRKRRLRWPILAVLGASLLVWIAFFDSHSILKRVQWHHESAQLQAENRRLREQIDQVRRDLDAVNADAVIEKVAREQYGMRRPGETVYRVSE